MERLTKRSNKTVHENGVCCTHFLSKECEERSGFCTDDCPWEEAAWSKLADYEDAEEQGVLLRLPCKVGDTVWQIHTIPKSNRKIIAEVVADAFFIALCVLEGRFDKTVFLTYEEAESALAEKGAENERM